MSPEALLDGYNRHTRIAVEYKQEIDRRNGKPNSSRPPSNEELYRRNMDQINLLKKQMLEGLDVGDVMKVIYDSPWGRTDPKMRKEDWEVTEFMEELMAFPHYFQELTSGQQSFVIMIIDSYRRYLQGSRASVNGGR
jgi:hypothetical protein